MGKKNFIEKNFYYRFRKNYQPTKKKFRHNLEIESEHSDSLEGKIEVIKNNTWVTICRFSLDESLDNIVTMFNVNYEVHIASNKVNT